MSKQDYELLCKEVEKIDRDAARYLREEAPKLDDFGYDIFLVNCIVFTDTHQGHDYWANIAYQLPEPYGWK